MQNKLKFEKKEAVQKQIQASTDEINQLKKSCAALRDELENLKFEKKKAVQDAILNSSQEIKELKLSISDLRNELESLKKKEAVQKAVVNSSDEIKQLKLSTQGLRDELEKVIKNYENKLTKIIMNKNKNELTTLKAEVHRSKLLDISGKLLMTKIYKKIL